MATVTTMTPAAARKKLVAARAKVDAARGVLRLAEERLIQCERDLNAAEAAQGANDDAKCREKAERETAKACAKAEREAAKAQERAEREAARARAKADAKSSNKAVRNGSAKVDDTVVDDLVSRYRVIRDQLAQLSYAEIRARIGEFSNYPKPVIAEVLRRIGYGADGSKSDLVQEILSSLERIKVTIDQTARI